MLYYNFFPWQAAFWQIIRALAGCIGMTTCNTKSVKNVFCLSLLSLAVAYGPVLAQGLDSHVHGEAELNLALVGQQIQIEFISPALNLLGFERAPDSPEETERLNSVSADLQSAKWLVGDVFRNCQLSTVTFEAPEFEDDTHEHDEDHDEGGAHAEFHVQYLFDCPSAPAKEFTVFAFERFGGIEEITVQWIVEGQQGLAQLTANNPILRME